MSDAETEIHSVHCNRCRLRTNHRLLQSHVDAGADEHQGFEWRTEYEMFVCLGCDEVVLRRTHWFSEDPQESVAYFPPAASRWVPGWRWRLPGHISDLLGEVYTALQAGSLSLAMMGARAIIETAMVQTVGDHGNFPANLNQMEQAGHLSANNRQYLQVALDAGSASAHRAHRPTPDQVNTVMDIVENLLHSLFVLAKQTAALKAAIPPRPKIKKALTPSKTK